MAWRAKALDDRGGGLSRGEGDDDALPAPAPDFGGADDGFGRIVSALDDDVRTEVVDQLERGVLVEHRDGIDGLQPGEHVGALRFAADRAVRSLEAPDARVAVEADDERVAALTRTTKDVEVSGVQQVKNAVGEYDAAPLPRAPFSGALPIKDLSRGVEGDQKVLSTRG